MPQLHTLLEKLIAVDDIRGGPPAEAAGGLAAVRRPAAIPDEFIGFADCPDF